MNGRKLGKLAPRHDARTFMAARGLSSVLPVIPPSKNWMAGAEWPMWENDHYGCCTQVSVASAIRTWTGAAQGSQILLSNEQVLENYTAVTSPPFDPAQPMTDRGAVELDVLNRWCREGLVMPGQPGRSYLTGFGAIRLGDFQSVQRAIAFLGGVYIGLSLPQWAVMEGCGDWGDPPSSASLSIAGGHAVWIHGYDADWLYLNTWGERKRMSWKFFLRHCDEIWALVSRQHWTGVSGLSPEGEALEHLVSEMQASVR
ncbi:MAG: hypothetical protein LKH33_03395 [Acetobacter sp.]|jgi:hypothetical protein|nr:hypothetical protein [Acetobacter sp.]MCH4061007.1 hypothetical protein [Acetobacter sp.]MCH4087947.1 hypothetical protein [Acetobacter sp.]MCI1293437.1 hypothetical protein [Acetobacter sp.]MCI1319721.1 hypothetical protein [Acetobacter sp.]